MGFLQGLDLSLTKGQLLWADVKTPMHGTFHIALPKHSTPWKLGGGRQPHQRNPSINYLCSALTLLWEQWALSNGLTRPSHHFSSVTPKQRWGRLQPKFLPVFRTHRQDIALCTAMCHLCHSRLGGHSWVLSTENIELLLDCSQEPNKFTKVKLTTSFVSSKHQFRASIWLDTITKTCHLRTNITFS